MAELGVQFREAFPAYISAVRRRRADVVAGIRAFLSTSVREGGRCNRQLERSTDLFQRADQ